MSTLEFDNFSPDIAADAYVADNARLIRRVKVGEGSGIFFGAVICGNTEHITVGRSSNIQDNAMIHTDPGKPAVIGDHVSVEHGAVVHGCTVEDGSLIGMNATVLNRAVISTGSLVAAGAVVLEGSIIPPGSLVADAPAKVRRPLTAEEQEGIRHNAERYASIVHKYLQLR